jgi:hypothetical protein
MLLDSAAVGGLGLDQLNQPKPGVVLLQPAASKQGKHTMPAFIQVRRDKTIRMATRPSLNKFEMLAGQSPDQVDLSRNVSVIRHPGS